MRLRVLVAGLIPAAMGLAAALLPAAQVNAEMTDQDCLGCHGTAGFSAAGADGKDRPLHVPPGPFARSVHGKLGCAMCHADVTAVPHELKNRAKVDCGSCHAEQKEQYAASVHAKEIEKGNPKAATCARCHSTHAVVSPKSDEGKLAIIEQCGSCHRQNFESYTDTYHGKVTALGFTYTAKCFDCHGSHSILRVADPKSTVHPDRRLATCQKCHAGATTGFVSFQPHANAHDFERYPQVWLAAKSMAALLAGVFLFFWTHTALWFYREFRDRQARKSRPHVATDELPNLQGKQFRRFGPITRLAHLVFALSVMALVLTGMAVHFADTVGAKIVIDALGGPRAAALVHRTAAAIMLGIFFLHVLYLAASIGGNLRAFRVFGPTSMIPNWQDLKDIIAMFQWFFGMRPRPVFDRWTYWEKFDYWAVFWGMAIIGGSGAMLAFPAATASVLPGWTFNVAAIVHGHEAILAAVFLFTVHFFNNHFRPDKFPLDIVMFTGAVPLEEFRREHALEYERLVQSGELQRHLVDAPSRPMTLASKALGFALIAIGLALLVAVLSGWMGLATVR